MEMDEAQANDVNRKYGEIVAKAWADEAFKQRLLAEPNVVLKEEGLELPQGVEFRVVENTPNVVYLPLPPTPSEELSDEQLEQVAGGACSSSAGTLGTVGCVTGTASTASTIGTVGTN